MVGTLTKSQIFEILHMQIYGRLACKAGGKIYVVPISYTFDGKFLYAHSREGQKIEMLRQDPHVCFQVDMIDSLSNWRSAIIWGQYHELRTPKDQAKAIKLLDARFGPLQVTQSISLPSPGIRPPESVEKKKKAVYFRVSIDDMSGRFENTNL